MKLHLPKSLFTAVIAAICCVQQVKAASYEYDYAGTIYTLGSSTNSDGTLSGNVYETTKAEGGQDWQVSETAISTTTSSKWESLFYANDYNTLRINTGNVAYHYKFANFTVGGIIVEDGLAQSTIEAKSATTADRGMTIGNTDVTATSYFGSDFKIDNSITNSTTGITLKGTQNWYLANNKDVELATNNGISNTATWNISGSGNLIISDTITNSGSISIGEGVTVKIGSLWEGISKEDAADWNTAQESGAISTTYTVISGGTTNITSVMYGAEKIALQDGKFARSVIYAVASDMSLEEVYSNGGKQIERIGIQSEKTLTHSANVSFTNTPYLMGSGVYALGGVAAGGANAKLSSVILDDSWSGTVSLFSTSETEKVQDINFNDLGREGTTVEITKDKTLAGYLKKADNTSGNPYLTFNPHLRLNGTLNINDAYASSQYTFAGGVSGSGTFKTTRTAGANNTYIFSGALNDWTGSFDSSSSTVSSNVKFQGSATTVNATIKGHQNLSMIVDNTGKITTFNEAVSVGSLTVTNGSTAKFTATDETSSASKLSVSGNITLGKGAALDVTGSITLNANNIRLADGITFDSTDAVTLVTVTDGTLTVNNVDTWTGSTYEIDGKSYTTSLSVVDNSLKLNFTPDSLDTLDVYVKKDGSGYTEGTLTLAMVDVNGNLIDTAADNYNVIGLYGGAEWDAIRELITDGANPVAITLQGAEGFTIEGSGDTNEDPEVGAGNVSFYGKYYGEAGGSVGTAGSYNPNYIPEPASATLGLAALMMLATRRRRKA